MSTPLPPVSNDANTPIAHIAHIAPSRHSTDEVDDKLRDVERNIEQAPGAGSPAIKPNPDLGEDGKPAGSNPLQPPA